MGYVHSYHQVKSVPNDQWLLLTTMVANVFLLTQYRFVPGFSDRMVICTADGKYPLLKPSELLVEGLDGQPAISFNGEERQDASYETFHLGQHSSGCGFCKTTFLWKPCRPYDFMVKATLLIAHRFCPSCLHRHARSSHCHFSHTPNSTLSQISAANRQHRYMRELTLSLSRNSNQSNLITVKVQRCQWQHMNSPPASLSRA